MSQSRVISLGLSFTVESRFIFLGCYATQVTQQKDSIFSKAETGWSLHRGYAHDWMA
jgi:hypothetical protein